MAFVQDFNTPSGSLGLFEEQQDRGPSLAVLGWASGERYSSYVYFSKRIVKSFQILFSQQEKEKDCNIRYHVKSVQLTENEF